MKMKTFYEQFLNKRKSIQTSGILTGFFTYLIGSIDSRRRNAISITIKDFNLFTKSINLFIEATHFLQ
jgi:hypothetical protein